VSHCAIEELRDVETEIKFVVVVKVTTEKPVTKKNRQFMLAGLEQGIEELLQLGWFQCGSADNDSVYWVTVEEVTR
jgi:hypothetical protein